jgi:hypothetical protein
LHRVKVLGEVVAIELSIRGTFPGPLTCRSAEPARTGRRGEGGSVLHAVAQSRAVVSRAAGVRVWVSGAPADGACDMVVTAGAQAGDIGAAPSGGCTRQALSCIA